MNPHLPDTKCLCPPCYDYTHLLVGRDRDGRLATQYELDVELRAWARKTEARQKREHELRLFRFQTDTTPTKVKIDKLSITSDYELLKRVCSGETVKHTSTKYIPEEIINECAYEAYRATYNHYERTTRPDINVWDTDPRLQKRVIKDVKAVLYGNRTPAQLHEAWAARKLQAFGWNFGAALAKHPTITTTFGRLTEDDRRGYEIFVDTVKATYLKFSYNGKVKQESKSARPVRGRLFKCNTDMVGYETEFGVPYSDNHALVELYFSTFEEAQRFYNLVTK